MTREPGGFPNALWQVLQLGLLASVLVAARPASPEPQPAQAPAPVEDAGPADPLSPLVRSLLKRRMDHHAQAMNRLVASVLMLRYQDAQVAADYLLDQPFWAGPGAGGPGDLNATLPADFFRYQGRLREAARAVSTAAGQRQPAPLAEAFGRLTQSCVACHAAYLPPESADPNTP